MSTENWKPVPGFEGSYEVSDLGRVRSLDRWVEQRGRGPRFFRGKVLKPDDSNPDGYLRVGLSCSADEKNTRIQILVLTAFVGPSPKGSECCHGNNIRSDNRLTNLRWDTHSANLRERGPYDKFRVPRGERQHLSKLSEADVREIRARYAAGGISQQKLADEFGVTQATVSFTLLKKGWKHVL